LDLKEKIKIIEVSSDYFSKVYFAPRPDSERLINKKLNLRGLNKMRDWKIALREYLENYYQDYLINLRLNRDALSYLKRPVSTTVS